MSSTKEELRPIEYNTNDNPEMPIDSKMAKGWFHAWYPTKLPNGNDVMMALIELEDGNMHDVVSSDLKFIDR